MQESRDRTIWIPESSSNTARKQAECLDEPCVTNIGGPQAMNHFTKVLDCSLARPDHRGQVIL